MMCVTLLPSEAADPILCSSAWPRTRSLIWKAAQSRSSLGHLLVPLISPDKIMVLNLQDTERAKMYSVSAYL